MHPTYDEKTLTTCIMDIMKPIPKSRKR